jgi:hypothetical protein
MVNQKLVEYIKSNLDKGHNLEEIRKYVVNYGWSHREFDEAVLEASGSAAKPPKPSGAEKGEAGAEDIPGSGKKKGIGKKVIAALIILLILVLVFFFVMADIVNYFTSLYPETILPF